MIESVYQIYKKHKELIRESEWATTDEDKSFIEDIKLSNALVDEKLPEYKKRYEKELANQKSFTPEQVDFICYQIGEWYLQMKPLLEGKHNLGYMKEKLKTMICGE